MAGVSDCTAG